MNSPDSNDTNDLNDLSHRTVMMLIVLLLLAMCCTGGSAHGASPSLDPYLRVEGGGHTGTISQLELNADRSRIVTVSPDKTLRVWSTADLSLERTVRMPLEPGYEGSLYALAIAPDAEIAAVSGWTGYTYERSVSVYFVDLDTGRFVARVNGLDEIVNNMRFSPDGRFVYVALAGGKGVRVIERASETIVAEDRDFSASAIGIEFLDGRRVAISSHDGLVRLYGPQLERLSTHQTTGGSRPTAVRVSPDGRSLAVGFIDRAAVEILSATDGSTVAALDADCFAQQRNTPRVFWSSDGERLFAYGTYDGVGNAPLYAWSHDEGRFGACERISTRRRNFGDIDVLDEHTLAIATTEPSVGTLDLRSGEERLSGRLQADFRDASDGLYVSRSGGRVRFPTARGAALMEFDLTGKALRRVNDTRDDATLEPHPGGGLPLRLDTALPGRELIVDGTALPLDSAETAHAIVALQDRTYVVATGFGLVRFRDGAVAQRVASPDQLLSLTLSGDGELLVALAADGTIRWHRASDLKRILTLFVDVTDSGEEPEWICWTPDGYYLSSNYGDRLVGWHLNNDIDSPANFFAIVQYETLLYRPDIVLETFLSRGDERRVRGMLDGELDIRGVSPGPLELTPLKSGLGVATIRIEAAARELDLHRLSVFVNDIPVLPKVSKRVRDDERRELVRELEIPLEAVSNDVRVEISNGKSLAVGEMEIVHTGGPPPERRGDLYVVSIGVSEFTNADGVVLRDLNFAADDSSEFARAMRTRGPKLFDRVEVIELSDYNDGSAPTRENIAAALKGLSRATAFDTVVVFLASHGFSDVRGNYYFLPRDVELDDVDALLDGREPGGSVLGWQLFLDTLSDTAGRRLMIVDTCAARGISGPQDAHSLAKRSAAASFGLLAASADDEESQEIVRLGHGLFTWALLQSLDAEAVGDKDGIRTLEELYVDLLPLVERYRIKSKPQSPQLVALPTLRNMPLVR